MGVQPCRGVPVSDTQARGLRCSRLDSSGQVRRAREPRAGEWARSAAAHGALRRRDLGDPSSVFRTSPQAMLPLRRGLCSEEPELGGHSRRSCRCQKVGCPPGHSKRSRGPFSPFPEGQLTGAPGVPGWPAPTAGASGQEGEWRVIGSTLLASPERCLTGPQSPKWRLTFRTPLVPLFPSPEAGVPTPALSSVSHRKAGPGLGVAEVTFQGETGPSAAAGRLFPVWGARGLCPARAWRVEKEPAWGRRPEPACCALTPHLTPRDRGPGGAQPAPK